MMAGLLVTLGVLGALLAAPHGLAALILPAATRPPLPRHVRPAGRTTQTEPAPSPVVSPTMTDDQRQALRAQVPTLGQWSLSPLSQESLRRRLRIGINEALGRPVV